jgi:hypothetical protein
MHDFSPAIKLKRCRPQKSLLTGERAKTGKTLALKNKTAGIEIQNGFSTVKYRRIEDQQKPAIRIGHFLLLPFVRKKRGLTNYRATTTTWCTVGSAAMQCNLLRNNLGTIVPALLFGKNFEPKFVFR